MSLVTWRPAVQVYCHDILHFAGIMRVAAVQASVETTVYASCAHLGQAAICNLI